MTFVTKYLREQVNKAAVVAERLKNAVWRNRDMLKESKVRVHKTCVRPIMTYGIETRADTTRTKNLLRTTEMKTLRPIAGVTLRDRVRNSEIRRICEVEDVVRWGRTRRRFWRDHVGRASSDRMVRIVTDEFPAGNRPPGRPPKRWRDSWTSTSQEQTPRRTGHSPN